MSAYAPQQKHRTLRTARILASLRRANLCADWSRLQLCLAELRDAGENQSRTADIASLRSREVQNGLTGGASNRRTAAGSLAQALRFSGMCQTLRMRSLQAVNRLAVQQSAVQKCASALAREIGDARQHEESSVRRLRRIHNRGMQLADQIECSESETQSAFRRER